MSAVVGVAAIAFAALIRWFVIGLDSDLLWIAAIILDIFAVSDVMRSNRDTTSKVVLIVLILLFPIIGAGLYLLVFRDKGY